MRTTRDVEPRLRRARLLAARQQPFWAIPRRAILAEHYDAGTKVRDHITGEAAQRWAVSRGFSEDRTP
jgi:hypothetical protein